MDRVVDQNAILADEVGLLLGEVVAVLGLPNLNYFGQQLLVIVKLLQII